MFSGSAAVQGPGNKWSATWVSSNRARAFEEHRRHATWGDTAGHTYSPGKVEEFTEGRSTSHPPTKH